METIGNIRQVQSRKAQEKRSNVYGCGYHDEETVGFQTEDSVRLDD